MLHQYLTCEACGHGWRNTLIGVPYRIGDRFCCPRCHHFTVVAPATCRTYNLAGTQIPNPDPAEKFSEKPTEKPKAIDYSEITRQVS